MRSWQAASGYKFVTVLGMGLVILLVCTGGQFPAAEDFKGQETAVLTNAPLVPPPMKRDHPTKVIVNLEVREAVQRLMREHNIRHVPVVSGKRLVGILPARDVREASPSPATTLTRGELTSPMETTPMKTCMTKNVVWRGPDVDMVHAARLLLQPKVGCLPVVEDGTLVGMVTETDCLRAFLDTAHGAEVGGGQGWTNIPKAH